MQVNRLLLILFPFILLLPGCIEPFNPEIDEKQISLVVDGTLTDQEGYHSVRISRSSGYNDPEFTPETGCLVEIISERGDRVILNEYNSGLYEQWIEQSFLEINQVYQLHIITGEGTEYYSYPDTLFPCAPLDHIYYEQETRETFERDRPMQGIQFFTDIEIPEHHARNYRWKMEETWEYHAPHLIQFIYTGEIIGLEEESDSLKYCWKTQDIHNIRTLTTSQVVGNNVNRIPLIYVSNQSNRLKVKYSLLVKQYSLSEQAYQYWYQLENQSSKGGELYETQPVRIEGNVYNPSDPDERILGYFNVSAVKEKRIFVRERFHFQIYDYPCRLYRVEDAYELGLSDIPESQYPVYLVPSTIEGPPWFMAEDICFDCTRGGGKLDPPDFWEP